jgi:heme/copper-type cytochrome/quinol oxidase subunit 4
MKTVRLLPRVLLLLTVATALLGGLGSGLARLGWQMDSFSQNWILVHGPLMICGFLGTLICLERAVALASRYRWSMVVPLVNAAGAIVLLLARDAAFAKFLLTAGSLGLVILFCLMLRLHPSRDMTIMASGAACWLVGSGLWLAGQPVYQVVHFWTAFLMLTIVGERLELSRVRRLTRTSEYLLTVTAAVYLAGVALTIWNLDLGIRLSGMGAILMAAWLLRYDIAGRTIRQTGLPRYIAACLLSGYIWLGFGGFIGIWKGALYAGPEYAALLHAYLLGFVFSMIFGHAPIILPAVTGLRLNYTPLFYGHLIVLHVTLVYRMYGNLMADFNAQRWSGLLNVIAVLLFLTVTLYSLYRANFAVRNSRKPPIAVTIPAEYQERGTHHGHTTDWQAER